MNWGHLELNWGLACKHAHIYFWLSYTILIEWVIGILKRDLRGIIFRACSQKESGLFCLKTKREEWKCERV